MRYTLNDTAINAYKTYAGGGVGTLELVAQAAGTTIKRGSGTSTLELQASAHGAIARSGSGSIVLELLARQGMPDPHAIPALWLGTHPSRRVVVPYDDRRVVVDLDDRIVHVPQENRVVTVPPDEE